MTDVCENFPEHSSNRDVSLVQAYCTEYDRIFSEAQELTGKAKLEKLNEAAGVLNKAREIQQNRNKNDEWYENQRIEIIGWLSVSPKGIKIWFLNQSSIGIVESDRKVNSIPWLTPWQRANGVMNLLEHSGASYYFSAGKWGGRIIGQLESISIESEDGKGLSSNDLILREWMSGKFILRFKNPGQPSSRNQFSKRFEISYQNWSLGINEEWRNLKSFEHIDTEILRRNNGIIKIILGNSADNEGYGKRTVLFLKIAGIQ